MKYSKNYAKNKSFYIVTFDEMALKTALNSLLRKLCIMSVELQQAYKSYQAVITTNDEKIYIDNDSNAVKNNGQINDEPLLNNINCDPSYTEIAHTNDNVVKEEDISNVVPPVVNNDEKWSTW